MYISILASLFCAIIPFSLALFPTRLVYEFPKGTKLENLCVRSSGSLLLTSTSTQNFYLIDPLVPDPQPELLYTFPPSTQLLGITETDSETYYVIAADGTNTSFLATPGSHRIYRVHFPGPVSLPEVRVAAVIKDAQRLNGLVTLNPTTLLASDSVLGVIWAIDVATGASRIVIKDPLMSPPSAINTVPFGINGIRLFTNHTLYFANSGQDIFANIRIHANGTAASPALKIASAPNGSIFDDFALNRYGDAFVATEPGDSIVEVTRNGTTRLIAGAFNTTEIAESSSAQFGRTARDRDVLYVTTIGRSTSMIEGQVVVGAQIVAIDLRGVAR